MSKWTLIRKTQVATVCCLHNLRECCFKMKVDHRKTQGGTKFSFENTIVKLQVEIQTNKHSNESRRRGSARTPIL